MATTSPPSPPASPAPRGPLPPPVRSSGPGGAGRLLAGGSLALVALIVAYLVFAGGGGANYKLELNEAGQLVRGDQVQVGGVPVGSVKDIELTKDFKAVITFHVAGSLTPLHAGTTAQIRVPSLSSVANRYIALFPGPNSAPALPPGSTLPSSATREVVDLDKLFNIFTPATRKGLQEVIQGSAEQYAGAGPAVGKDTELFSPSFAATDHLFAELVRDQPVFTNFLVESAKAVTTIGGRSEQLTDLIGNADSTFAAIGSQQENLARALRQLPITLRQGSRTFVGLVPTLAALNQLVNASKPTSQPLTTLFTRLRPLVTTATPVVHNFSLAINRPGPNNDLTDYFRALPGLARALSSASPASVTALKESVPITAFWGPYTPDLTGLLRSFGQTAAYYDANGHYARLSPVFPDFKLGANNNLTPSTAQQALETLKAGQLRRCPGGATAPAGDGSSPFTYNGMLSCNPLDTP